ncbi:hypothetical protein BgiBS90_021714, partial [Biomphalaria glabrata]
GQKSHVKNRFGGCQDVVCRWRSQNRATLLCAMACSLVIIMLITVDHAIASSSEQFSRNEADNQIFTLFGDNIYFPFSMTHVQFLALIIRYDYLGDYLDDYLTVPLLTL